MVSTELSGESWSITSGPLSGVSSRTLMEEREQTIASCLDVFFSVPASSKNLLQLTYSKTGVFSSCCGRAVK